MSQNNPTQFQDERVRRWRLILGKTHEDEPENEGQEGEMTAGGDPSPSDEGGLGSQDQQLDDLLGQLYGDGEEGDLSDSAPDVARWLGDIRHYFPDSVVQMMQHDALEKYKLRKLLDHPDLIQKIEPDVNMVAELMRLRRMLPNKTRDTAREVVRRVVEELVVRLRRPMEQALAGNLNRAEINRRPKFSEINWLRTIHSNLKHYQPRYKTVVPEHVIGYGRRRTSLKDVVLCVDTSASMGKSVVYASIYASVMASIQAVSTRLLLFDSSVVDMTGRLADPVDMIFGLRLGGGTDIQRALTYAHQLTTRPADTTVILITDLFEGGNKNALIERAALMRRSGVQIIVLLALSDSGAPRFNREIAQQLAALDIPSFACTPDRFPDLMGALLNGQEIKQFEGYVDS